MNRLAKLLRPALGERPIDRVFLVAGLFAIGILVVEMRSTFGGTDVNVTIETIVAANE